MSAIQPEFSLADKPCNPCGFDMYIPIADIGGVATLGLYNDGRFPGRSVLGLNQHYDAMEELPDDLYQQFSFAGLIAVRAISDVTGAKPINYATLCNRVPHVHSHIIPRQLDQEPRPGDPPWNDPRPKFEMPRSKVDALCNDIGAAVTQRFANQSLLASLRVITR